MTAKNNLILATAITAMIGSGIAFASDLNGVMNSFSAYGNLAGISNSGGNSSAGVGVKGAFMTNQGWMLSADWHHDFNALFKSPYQTTGGGMTGINVKAGYLFPFSQDLRVGPYLAYQYTHFGINFDSSQVQNASLHFSNNAIGGGLEAGYGIGPLVFTGDVAYLAGIIATSTIRGNGYNYSASTIGGSSDMFQVGLQANYQISGPWFAMAGFKYDDYMNGSGNLNLLQGNVGFGYSF
ncbi:hypothetical protein HAP94_11045 [Acidithiobacillus ferrivorans]|nr:hypothetical protein [Acidithiobacillus ferrivorans]